MLVKKCILLPAAVVLLAASGAAAAQPGGPVTPGATMTVQEYAVPFICGRNVTRSFPVTEGDFATAVFIHNPGGRIQISHRTATAKGARPGPLTPFKAIVLERNEAVLLSCLDLPRQTDWALSTGFLVIRSATDLDVVAVHSDAPIGDQGVDTYVRSERISARRVTIPANAGNAPD